MVGVDDFLHQDAVGTANRIGDIVGTAAPVVLRRNDRPYIVSEDKPCQRVFYQ